jgi:hypothetical protein
MGAARDWDAMNQTFDRLFQAIGRTEGWMELARE